jgi:hypothetical protein
MSLAPCDHTKHWATSHRAGHSQVCRQDPDDLRGHGVRLLAVFVLVVDNVDDIAVWRTDKEPAHPPRLRSQRMNDLKATSLRLLICRLDLIADMNRDHRIDR